VDECKWRSGPGGRVTLAPVAVNLVVGASKLSTNVQNDQPVDGDAASSRLPGLKPFPILRRWDMHA
jgi:hypothetical protein